MILGRLQDALPLFLAASLALPSAEQWRWNSWERTRHGIERLRRGDAPGAVEALDTAARVAGRDPRVLLNAGAAHLLAGDPEGALPLLEQAARSAPEEMAASAQYHLGTARLAASGANAAHGAPGAANLEGAVEALQEALRLQPDFAAAKHNLELALRAQERQRQQEEERQQQSQANEQKSSPEPRPADEEKPAGRPEKRPSNGPKSKPEQGLDGGQPESQRGQQPAPANPLQTRLTPEQVASLLASVDNLERQQRRQQSLKKLLRPAGLEKDW
jgi:hypothetical protein